MWFTFDVIIYLSLSMMYPCSCDFFDVIIHLSLCTIVLNSRDWPEKQRRPQFMHLLNPRYDTNYVKKLPKIYWCYYNYIVPFWALINFQCFIQNILLKISKCNSISSIPACLPQDPVVLVLRLQFFHTKKVTAMDLRNCTCCSKECLSTVPLCFLLSFIS